MRTGKIWMAAAALCFMAWQGVSAADTAAGQAEEPFKLQGILRKGKQVVQNALYLDKSSIHVIDVAPDSVTVTADLLETANEKDFRARSVLFRLSEEGKQSVFGDDAAWHELSDATDDPVAVASREVWQEIGKAERRDEFLQEIQQILVKKAEAAEAEKEKKENPETVPADDGAEISEAAAKDEPVEIFVEVPPDPSARESAAVSEKTKKESVKKEKKEKKETKTAESAVPKEEPPVVVEIEARE